MRSRLVRYPVLENERERLRKTAEVDLNPLQDESKDSYMQMHIRMFTYTHIKSVFNLESKDDCLLPAYWRAPAM